MVLFKKEKKKKEKDSKSRKSTISKRKKSKQDTSNDSNVEISRSSTEPAVTAKKMDNTFSEYMDTPNEEIEEEKVTVHLPVICKAVAICGYEPEQMEQVDEDITFLRFDKGDMIDVVEQDESGWWEGIVDGEWGIFPGSYVEITEIYSVVEEENENVAQVNNYDDKLNSIEDNNQYYEEVEDTDDLDNIIDEMENEISSKQVSLDEEGEEMDDILSDLISSYEQDVQNKPVLMAPEDSDESDNNELDYVDDYQYDEIDDNIEQKELPSYDDFTPEDNYELNGNVIKRSTPPPTDIDMFSDFELELGASEVKNNNTGNIITEIDSITIEHTTTAKNLDNYLKDTVNNTNNDLLEEITSLKLRLNDSKALNDKLQANFDNNERKLLHLQKENNSLHNELNTEVNNRNIVEEEKIKLSSDLESSQVTIKSLKEQILSNQKETKHLREQVKNSMENNSEAQLSSLQNQVNELQNVISQKDKFLQEKDEKILQLQTLNSSLSLKVKQLQDVTKGEVTRQGSNVKLLEEKVKILTEHNELLSTQLHMKSQSEIKLSNKIQSIQQQSRLNNKPPTRGTVNQRIQRGTGRGRGKPRGAPRGGNINPNRATMIPRGNASPRGGNNSSVRTTLPPRPVSNVPRENGNNNNIQKTNSQGRVLLRGRGQFARPTGPQGKPIQRRLIKEKSQIPASPPPILKDTLQQSNNNETTN